MLRINRQTDYAIRVLLALSKRGQGVRVPTAHIQREMLIPAAFSQRIVADLAQGHFILTFPGRSGGLSLAHPPREINLRQVVEYFEGPLLLSECLLQKGDCPLDTKCPVHCQWGRLQALILHELESITFEQLAEDARALDSMFGEGNPGAVSL
ncbi:MAG: Rrf2 family transcriptional regulator [Chloroflexi bacterium]|nr:Rrf2 family transcriptional regulator [Chloroflexota bacterium]